MITVSEAVLDHFVGPDGRSAVMVGHQVAVLSELGTVLLAVMVADGPVTADDLVEAANESLGPPPEEVSLADAVGEALAALRALGAVVEVSRV